MENEIFLDRRGGGVIWLFYADFFILSKLQIKGVRISSNILAIKMPFPTPSIKCSCRSLHKVK